MSRFEELGWCAHQSGLRWRRPRPSDSFEVFFGGDESLDDGSRVKAAVDIAEVDLGDDDIRTHAACAHGKAAATVAVAGDDEGLARD